MLSRVADSIFWMSRYIERAENVARFIDVNLQPGAGPGRRRWPRPVGAAGRTPPATTSGSTSATARPTQQNVIEFLTFDDENPNSILSCLRAARENARTVREIISSAMWEELNKFYLMVRDARNDGGHRSTSPFEFFEQVKLAEPSAGGHDRRHDVARRGLALRPHGPARSSGPTRRRASST